MKIIQKIKKKKKINALFFNFALIIKIYYIFEKDFLIIKCR